MVFGYVFDPAKADIGELLACKDTSYSFPCLGKLYNIAKILTVGNMVVEVRSRGLLINDLRSVRNQPVHRHGLES